MSAQPPVDKRSAYEPPSALLAPVAADPRMPRPASITVGAVLVLLRVVAGVLWLLSLWFRWPDLLRSGWLGIDIDMGDPDTQLDQDLDKVDPSTIDLSGTTAALWIVLIIGATTLLVDLVLAVLIYRGVNFARVLVMTFSVLSISSAFVGWWASGQQINLETSLLTTALDVLVLLALSSRDAAAYARRKEKAREARTAPVGTTG